MRRHIGALFLLMLMTAFAEDDVRLITLDPGHFHAALFQKEMLPGISPLVHIYAPLGADLTAHLTRIAGFNTRPENPTHWELEIYAGPDFLERMLREHPGNVAVLSGRNRGKIDRIQACIGAGLHVLADKPWIIEASDLPKVEAALDAAHKKGVVAFDGMTERFSIVGILQKDLVNDPAIFGERVPGTAAEPGVYMESVHYLMKEVAGVPLLRPPWYFDITQQGEGLTDVGTHIVDIVPWTLFPGQPIDYRTDIQVTSGSRWPTVLSRADFQRVTGEKDFPDYLKGNLKNGSLEYNCNNRVEYTLRGIHVRLDVKWGWEAASDSAIGIYRGSKSSVQLLQGKEENYVPQVYVVPNRPADKAALLEALKRRVDALQVVYPGLAYEDQGKRMRLTIPERYRIGHEAHFARLVSTFLGYLRDPKTLPAWEKPNMLAKYYVTTRGVELARK